LEKSIDIDIKSVLLQEKYLRRQTIVEGANQSHPVYQQQK
jgi:hypothetical protein